MLQALERSKTRAESARVAAVLAEKALSTLEVQIPKAELEITACKDRAQDLKSRLKELKEATKVIFITSTAWRGPENRLSCLNILLL